MEKTITALFVLVGIIHLLPVVGVLGGERLSALYGLPLEAPDIAILMRHRAVLFGLLGLFFIYAAFYPGYQPLAFIGGFISVLSFIALALSVGGYNAEVARVLIADIIALVALVVAAVLAYLR